MKAMACRPEGETGTGWAESDDGGLEMRRESRTVQAKVGGHSTLGRLKPAGVARAPASGERSSP